jgi:hypothetical protein
VNRCGVLQASCANDDRLVGNPDDKLRVRVMARNNSRTVPLIAIAFAAATSVTACGRNRSTDIVALVDGVAIGGDDIRAALVQFPSSLRDRYRTPNGRKELLERTIMVKLIAAEARRTRLNGETGGSRPAKHGMIRLLPMHGGAAGEGGEQVSDGEMIRYYREHYVEFHKQEERRIIDVVVRDHRLVDRLRAEAHFARKSDKLADETAFKDMARQWSRQGTATVRDLGFLAVGSAAAPKGLVDAAFALDEAGAVSPPVEVGGVVHIVKVAELRAGYSRPFAAAKQQISGSIRRQAENDRRAALGADLRKSANVRIDERVLQTIDLTFPEASP